MLHIHKTVFWVDSSIRLHTANLHLLYKKAINRARGLLMFLHAGSNIFMVTHSKTYWYLPMSKASTISVKMHGAGVMFICLFKEVRNFVYTLLYIPHICSCFIVSVHSETAL